MDRTVNVIENLDGKKTVIIQDIRFRGKRNINWTDVERYLVEFIGDIYYIAENNNEEIYIDRDLPSEYTGSIYTKHLKGTVAKAKANASVGIPQLIEIATNPRFEKNHKSKHARNAKFGWYRYDTRFALPVFREDGEIDRFNVFHASLLIRHAADGRKYLYDIIEIKKETGKCCQE